MNNRSNLYRLFFILIFYLTVSAKSQTYITEKSERKLSLSPQIGVGIFPFTGQKDNLGHTSNIFSGYAISPMIGVGLWYKALPKLYLGTELNYMQSQRDISSLGLLGTGVKIKYNLVSARKLISPYLTGGLNVWFANISQNKQIKEFYPTDTSGAGQGIRVDQVDYKYNELNIYFAPIFGFSAGAGIDIKLTRKISLFFQASFQKSLATSDLINSRLPDNTGPLEYLTFQGGTNIRFYKNVKIRIDTQSVPVPDAIVLLTTEDAIEEKTDEINRESKFNVTLHEGMSHVFAFSSTDHEFNVDIDESPCKKNIKIFDHQERLVKEFETEISEKINITNLKQGKYKVVISPEPPCDETSFSYNISGNRVSILFQGDQKSPDTNIVAKRNALVRDLIASNNKLIDEKMKEIPGVLSLDLKMYKIYDLNGLHHELNGWGYQVFAFRSIHNVVKMMRKLKSEGYEVYVQSIMMHDIAVRFQSKENFKVNRLIVFAGESEVRSNEIKEILLENGYEIIVKEHFRPKLEKLSPLGLGSR